MTKTTNSRFRNWATVVYPESAKPQWKEYLSELKTPVFISPLHDSDVNPNGEPKKAHYHIMLMYDGKKSKEQILEVFDAIGGVGCEIVQTTRGYARYLCHLDNPEKHQYNVDDVISYGGADYMSTIGLPVDKYKAIREMMAWCNENGVLMYSDLLEYAASNRSDWFRLLCDSCTLVIKEYLKSKEYSLRSEQKFKSK